MTSIRCADDAKVELQRELKKNTPDKVHESWDKIIERFLDKDLESLKEWFNRDAEVTKIMLCDSFIKKEGGDLVEYLKQAQRIWLRGLFVRAYEEIVQELENDRIDEAQGEYGDNYNLRGIK